MVDPVDNVDWKPSLQLRHGQVDVQGLPGLTSEVRQTGPVQRPDGSQDLHVKS